jgi:hypothetical protein
VFGELVSLCAKWGLAKVGVIAVDGTKMHANASRDENLDHEQIARGILEEAPAVDAAEDELYAEALHASCACAARPTSRGRPGPRRLRHEAVIDTAVEVEAMARTIVEAISFVVPTTVDSDRTTPAGEAGRPQAACRWGGVWHRAHRARCRSAPIWR